ncbi:SDR family NAD(P)-dependent oxidoreductase [Microbacterium sp. NRRL B-14842]|uniref:SDR family NAD(P)-dependent oxidoreductase n=1 Tax=Microbacterium sp. NRRL B-14842 TaxID=3162881 RepID=UPI003D2E8BA5
MATHLLTGAGSGHRCRPRAATHGARRRRRGARARCGTARQIADDLPGASTLVGDLAQPGRLSWALSKQSLPDRIDSLVHAAGVVDLGSVGDLTPALWEQQLAVNLVAPAELTRLLLPVLRVSRGHVVFVNSGAGCGRARGGRPTRPRSTVCGPSRMRFGRRRPSTASA